MFVIIVYDISNKRVHKFHKYLKTKLNWIQNSVFEGNITKSEYIKIKTKLKKMVNKKNDSVIIFLFHSQKYFKKEVLGLDLNETTNVI